MANQSILGVKVRIWLINLSFLGVKAGIWLINLFWVLEFWLINLSFLGVKVGIWLIFCYLVYNKNHSKSCMGRQLLCVRTLNVLNKIKKNIKKFSTLIA